MVEPTITNELMYEVMKAIQADIATIKRDLRSVKGDVVSVRTIMGESIKSEARRETDYFDLETRIERIERRLQLQDNP